MSKTFKSIAPGSNSTIEIAGTDGNVTVYVHQNIGAIDLSATDAPALALAILEAAGLQNVPHDSANGAEKALGYLIEYVGLERANAKAAADREALEAEAAELLAIVHPSASGESWPFDKYSDYAQGMGLALARKARERHGSAQ